MVERPVEKAWLSFSESVIAPDADEVQRRVQRETFYAGAYMMLTLLLGKNRTQATLRAIHNEMAGYVRDVEEGAKRKS